MKIASSYRLPCGVLVNNRIVKSAMSENMADENHLPTERIFTLYREWAKGEAGILITGNIMIDANALGEHRNIVVEDESCIENLSKWAKAVDGTQTQLWGQINHPGRQAMKGVNREIVAPSSKAVKTPMPGLFPKPRALEEDEIWELIHRFGNTALLLKNAGFHGVQIHGAHGYLISQFLSPLTNLRQDQWGGSLENRARFVVEVYKNIRQKVGIDFPVGIKINSADFQRGGFSEEDSMAVLQLLSSLNIDMIEVSGGTYEKAAMMGNTSKQSTLEREAYFLEYIEKARKIIQTPLLLTGGFRTLYGMESALLEDKVDFVGVARPFCIFPQFPKEFFKNSRLDIFYSSPKKGIKFLDKMGFIELLWCQIQIHRISKGLVPDLHISPWAAVKKMIGL